MDELRILVVAEDPLTRAGLAALLADQPGHHLVGQIEGADILAELAIYQPDVVLWDLGWEPERALEQVADALELAWPVVALLPDETYAAEAWGAGLRGLMLRNSGPDKLAAALAGVAQELVVLDSILVDTLVPAAASEPMPLVEDLTPREREVLQLLAEGLANKAIAHNLGISEHTVKFHVNAILSKLGAQSRTEAVVQATRLGLIML